MKKKFFFVVIGYEHWLEDGDPNTSVYHVKSQLALFFECKEKEALEVFREKISIEIAEQKIPRDAIFINLEIAIIKGVKEKIQNQEIPQKFMEILRTAR